jgi:CubicO group peptidase (beta-lactamase class C family)
MSAYEFCKKYLYEPLNITSNAWHSYANGVNYTVSKDPRLEAQSDLSARDLAKIGFLFLDNGRNLVSTHYVKEALTPSKNEKSYGLLWWLFENGYGCRGYGGQEINVLPESNIVYVIQATATMQCKTYPDVFYRILNQLQDK